MKRQLEALMAHPTVAHLLRAQTRFGNRMGNQFAAAITYFSVLALVPIMMFAFSLLGMILTTLRPEWLGLVTDEIVNVLSAEGGGQQIANLITDYLKNWRAVGLFGLVSLFYAGSGWVGNLRGAVNAMWRPEFEYVEDKRNIVMATLANMGVLLLMLVGVLVTFSFSLGGTALSDLLIRTLKLDNLPGGSFLLRLATWAMTFISAWLLFVIMFVLLPSNHRLTKPKLAGAALAALFFTVLQIGAGALIGIFQNNKAASLFGPVIVLMLFMNLFARVTLLIASWIATSRQPAVAFHYNKCDEPLRHRDDTVTAEDHWEKAEEERREQAAEADLAVRRDQIPSVHTIARPRRHEPYRPKIVTLEEYPHPDPERMVSEPVAAKSVKVGMRAGWLAGTATGLGVGALGAAGLAALRRALKR